MSAIRSILLPVLLLCSLLTGCDSAEDVGAPPDLEQVEAAPAPDGASVTPEAEDGAGARLSCQVLCGRTCPNSYQPGGPSAPHRGCQSGFALFCCR